jgi:hypothetical protein
MALGVQQYSSEGFYASFRVWNEQKGVLQLHIFFKSIPCSFVYFITFIVIYYHKKSIVAKLINNMTETTWGTVVHLKIYASYDYIFKTIYQKTSIITLYNTSWFQSFNLGDTSSKGIKTLSTHIRIMLGPKPGPERKRMKVKCMRFLRILAGVTWRGKIPNDVITKEFGIVNVADSIKNVN